MNRKAKIICTIGPATRSLKMIRALARSGMDVVRVNFSHGTQEGHAQTIAMVRQVEEEIGRPLAILQDRSEERRVGKECRL